VVRAVSAPAAPDLPCACARWGFCDRGCVCTPLERWARAHVERAPDTPPLTEEARRYMAAETGRVEGYPTAENSLRRDDRLLSAGWLAAMADWCRDKGLIP
jgi:hypothetical protein